MRNFLFVLFGFLITALCQAETFYLRDNLKDAQKGDYLVTVHNKNYTMIVISDKKDRSLFVQEITIPHQRLPDQAGSWKSWVESGAPNHTSWVSFKIDLDTGALQDMYSFSHQNWIQISETDNLFSTLINMPFHPLPARQRRYVGTSDGRRKLWHPKMVVDGQVVPGVTFDAWFSCWPQDQSPLAGKTIQIYIPQPGQPYSGYFPYWMNIKGTVGKTQLRIVDSGSGLAIGV